LGFNHTGTESTTSAVLANSFGANSIVDWIILELRNPNSPTVVLHSRAALLQRDGDVVDTDGTSAVLFPNAAEGSYFVAVQHRNHLGFRTTATQSLSSTAKTLNFTNNSTALFGTSGLTTVSWNSNIIAMRGGDANHDGSIDASDSAIWENSNGFFGIYKLTEDYNLDGSVDATDSAIWEVNNGTYSEYE
jgi:hypothetical protein